jgi:hypothetical protein
LLRIPDKFKEVEYFVIHAKPLSLNHVEVYPTESYAQEQSVEGR